MRLQTGEKLPKNELISFTLQGLDGPLPLFGRVVWTKRRGFFKREVGIRFGQLQEATIAALRKLARAASYNETIRPELDAARRAG